MGWKEKLTEGPRWTIVTATAAAVTVGVAGVAYASGRDDDGLPGSISLQDGVPVTRTVEPRDGFDVVPAPILTGNSNDSPFDDDGQSFASPDDSPDQGPPPPPAPAPSFESVSYDSPDAPAPVAPAPSYDSPSFDSPDAPAPSAPAPSVDSYDSPDNSVGSVDSSFDS